MQRPKGDVTGKGFKSAQPRGSPLVGLPEHPTPEPGKVDNTVGSRA